MRRKAYRRAHVLLILLICFTLATAVYILNSPQKVGSAISRSTSAVCANGGATTIACTVTTPSNGSTLIAVIGTRGTTAGRVSSITQTGATWTRAVQSTNASGNTTEIWYAAGVTSAGTGVTVNLAASVKASAIIATYTGILTTSALDKTSSATGSSTTASTGTTTTTAQSNQVWVGGMTVTGVGTFGAPTNSFAEVAESASTGGSNATRNNTAYEERIVTATGTANTTSTITSAVWSGAIATFNASTSPTKIVFTTSAPTLTAGVCSGAITFQTQDSGNVPQNASSGVIVQVSSLLGGNAALFYTASDCSGSSVTTFAFSGSESSKTFYMKDTYASGAHSLLATKISGSDTLTDGNLNYTVNPGSISILKIALPGESFLGGSIIGTPNTITAGTSFTLTQIRALDAYDNVVTSYTGAKTLAYSGPSNAPSGTSPAYTTSVSFSSGVSTTTLTTTLYAAGSNITITATDGGLYGSSSTKFTVTPGALSNYTVALSGTTVTAGSCSANTGTITAYDSWQNTRTSDTSTVNLTTTATGMFFYDSSFCSIFDTQFTLSAGTFTFYWRPTKKESGVTITATKIADTPSGTSASITVNPGTATKLLVSLPGETFVDGTGITGSSNFTGTRTPNATAGTSFNVTLYAVDTYNNLVNSGASPYTGTKTISWTNSTAGNAPSGTAPTYPATSVAFTNGTSTTTLTATYVNATTSRTIQADDTGTPLTGTPSSTFTVQAAAVGNYGVSASTPQTAGVAFNVVITARDSYNNSLGSLYSAPSGTYVWSTTASAAPDSTAASIGTLAQANFTNGVATKSVTLYKAESGVTFTAGEPSPSTVTGTSGGVTVNAGALSSYGVTAATPITAGTCSISSNSITARDTWQNTITSDSSLVNATTTGTGVTFYTTSGCTTTTTQYTLSSGTANFYYKTNKKQTLTITVTKSGDTPTGTSSSVTVNPAATSTLVTRLPGQSFTDGTGVSGASSFTGLRSPNATAGTSFDVVVYALDAYNNLVDSGTNNYTGSKTISWANSTAGNAPIGTAPSYPATSVTFTNGTSTTTLSATYYNATTSRTIRADATSPAVTGTASSAFTVQAAAVGNYNVSASTPQTAGVAFNVVVTARDSYNNSLGSLYSAPAGTYVWSTTASSAPDGTAVSLGTLAQANFTNGVATKSVTLYKAESITITAGEPSPSTVTGVTSSVTVNPGNVSANTSDSTVTGSSTGYTDTAYTATITLKDTWRNPISGVNSGNITVSGTGSPTITQPSSNTDVNGQTTASLLWSAAGSYTVSVQIGTVSLVQNDGTTLDADGFLDSTLSVTVIVPPSSTTIRGGTIIRGGTTIR